MFQCPLMQIGENECQKKRPLQPRAVAHFVGQSWLQKTHINEYQQLRVLASNNVTVHLTLLWIVHHVSALTFPCERLQTSSMAKAPFTPQSPHGPIFHGYLARQPPCPHVWGYKIQLCSWIPHLQLLQPDAQPENKKIRVWIPRLPRLPRLPRPRRRIFQPFCEVGTCNHHLGGVPKENLA